MSKNFLIDSKLSKDCHLTNNSEGGNVDEWNRIKVKGYKNSSLRLGVNFSAQLYKNKNGLYKIAYRGLENSHTKVVLKINRSIVALMWTNEMSESVKFTFSAIKHIQKNEPELSFSQVVSKLEVTGYGQGGFEAELNAQLFGLNGTSIDCTGAELASQTEGWLLIKSWVNSKEPEAILDTRIGHFVARQYNSNIGLASTHFAGVMKDRSGMYIMQNAASPMMVDLAMQEDIESLSLYELDLIIYAEFSNASLDKVSSVINSAIEGLIFKMQKSLSTSQITQSPIILDLSDCGSNWSSTNNSENNSRNDKADGFSETEADDASSFSFEMLFSNDEKVSNFSDSNDEYEDDSEEEDEYCFNDGDSNIESNELEENESATEYKRIDDDKWVLSTKECFQIVCKLMESKKTK